MKPSFKKIFYFISIFISLFLIFLSFFINQTKQAINSNPDTLINTLKWFQLANMYFSYSLFIYTLIKINFLPIIYKLVQ